jgi:hypothetical protein
VGYAFWARADRALDAGGALVRAHAELETLVGAHHRRARRDRERNRLARHLAANAEPVTTPGPARQDPSRPDPDPDLLLTEADRLLAQTGPGPDLPPTPHPPSMATGVEEDDMRRRALLQALGATGALGALTDPDSLDAVRRGLDQALPGTETEPTPRDVEDWESLADRYDRGVGAEIPALFLAQVTRDLDELNGVLPLIATGLARCRLLRVAAQLAAHAGAMTIAVGRSEAATGWWRTARRAAERSGDTDLEVFVLADQALLSLYDHDGRAVPEASVALADRALAAAGDRLCSGTAKAHAARAQTSALLGRAETAEESLVGLRRLFDRLPAEITEDRTSWLSFSAYRLHHTESYVYSRLGDLSRAETARAQALAVYPAHRYRGRAQLTQHQATCLVRSGDLRSGVDLATSTLAGLPDQARGDRLVRDLTRLTLDAVPADAARHGDDRDAVHHLRELLAGA